MDQMRRDLSELSCFNSSSTTRPSSNSTRDPGGFRVGQRLLRSARGVDQAALLFRRQDAVHALVAQALDQTAEDAVVEVVAA